MTTNIEACLVTLLLGLLHTATAIDCYVCTSFDHQNTECEDSFKRDQDTVHLIQRNCVYGYFKGTHCIKLSGTREDGTSIVVRHCSDEDWGSHCGDIRYETEDGKDAQRITGCLEACDHDGCNATPGGPKLAWTLILIPLILAAIKAILPS